MAEGTQRTFLEETRRLRERGLLARVRVSTRPDCVGPAALGLLREYGVSTIELGIQSFDDEVLAAAGRGYSARTARDACERVAASGFDLVVQIMAFLPGAAEESDIRSAGIAASSGAAGLRIFPTVVLRGTELHRMWERGRYVAATVEEAVDRVARMLEEVYTGSSCTPAPPACAEPRRFPIDLLRIGLQDGEWAGSALVAGPHHPALGELCLARLLARQLGEAAVELSRETGAPVPISVSPRLVSLLAGHGRAGEKALAEIAGNSVALPPIPITGRICCVDPPSRLLFQTSRFVIIRAGNGLRVEPVRRS